MNCYCVGRFVKSKAGHDKDGIFIITREEGECVFLADGIHRKVEKPKRKKKKHVQPIGRVWEQSEPWTNEKIKKAIKVYVKEGVNV